MTSFALRLIPGRVGTPSLALPREVRIHEFRGRECTNPDDEAEERTCIEDTEYVAPRRLSPPSASALLNATNDGLLFLMNHF